MCIGRPPLTRLMGGMIKEEQKEEKVGGAEERNRHIHHKYKCSGRC